ncbi:MAG: hypothetical protein VKQ33_05040 [Candidatus Sericytochromatia bacterium]|nr:hypothetical protein [Candidatus Sericytochromatia bacterium]
MNRIALAGLVVAGFLVGGGAGWWLFVAPPLKVQEDRTRQRAAELGLQRELEAKLGRLEAARRGQGLARIAYFDLRGSQSPLRAMEARTVETLGGLTTIFQDQHLEIQALTPAGEVLGLNKPVPTPAPVAAPGASPTPTAAPTPTPGLSPTPAPIRLTHKVFRVTLRGEYDDIVRALNEIQALPQAISVNQYTVKLVAPPAEPGAAPPPPAGGSASQLELAFQLTISFVLGEPAAAGPQTSVLQRLGAWAWAWFEQPAEAAPEGDGGRLAPTDEGTRHSGADLLSPRPARSAAPRAAEGRRRAPGRAAARRPRPAAPRARTRPAEKRVPSPPAATPTPTPSPSEPSLRRSFSGHYAFPIQRDAATGRANPFKPLGVGVAAPPVATPGPGVTPPVLPVLPPPPAGTSGPAVDAGRFELLGTMAGGQAPMALLRVDGRTIAVGINQVVAGTARVRSIGLDRITLRVDGHDLTLMLKR